MKTKHELERYGWVDGLSCSVLEGGGGVRTVYLIRYSKIMTMTKTAIHIFPYHVSKFIQHLYMNGGEKYDYPHRSKFLGHSFKIHSSDVYVDVNDNLKFHSPFTQCKSICRY